MSIHAVLPGASLQVAVNAAQPGDEIVLTAGATYPPPLLTDKAGDVKIRGDKPIPDRRLTADDVGLLPILQSETVEPSLVGDGAANWRIEGIRIGATKDGMYNAVRFQGARNIHIDRLYFAGGSQGQRRAIMANGQAILIRRSCIENVWRAGEESQAIAAWDGSGPYEITDNFLQAAAESILFGGANSSRPENIPADILVEGNHCTKRLDWKGQDRVVKNNFELKSAKRAVIRRNRFEHNWTQGQNGYAILFTVRNDEGGAPWSVVEDVVFEDNDVLGTERGINILGYDSYQPSGRTDRITIRKNRIQVSEREVFQIGSEAGAVVIEDNVIAAPAEQPGPDGAKTLLLKLYLGAVHVAGSPARDAAFAVESLRMAGNASPSHRVYGEGQGWDNTPAILSALTKSYVFLQGNVIGGDPVPDPIPDPIPDPEPEPEPEPQPDIIGPDVRIAVLHRQGKSHNWETRADTDATDVVKVEFYINGQKKQTVSQKPFGTTLSLKGYRGDVTILAKAVDSAGNIGTASRTVVL